MDKNESGKKLRKYSKELMEGNEDFCYIFVNDTDKISTIGDRETKPHTLIILWQVGEMKILKGFINNKSIGLHYEDSKDKESVSAIINLSSMKNIEVLIGTKGVNEVYAQNFEKSDNEHKLVIYRENMEFSDMILFEPKVSLSPSYMLGTERTSMKYLRNIALSLICSIDNKIYGVIENEC